MASGIRYNLARDPDKVALICDGRELTYAQLVDRIDRVAALAPALGLQPGDRAAIVAANCIEYLESVDGLAGASIAVATPNPHQTAAEIGYILEDLRACTSVERVIVIGPECDDLLAQTRPAPSPAAIADWSAFSIPYTSGTTGKPGGVALPHRPRALLGFCMASEFGCYGPDDRFLAVTPMFHGAGFSFAHAAVFFGGTCEIMTSFVPEQFLRRLSDGGATGTFLVPTIFNALFALERPILDRYHTNSLRALISNAAPLPQKTREVRRWATVASRCSIRCWTTPGPQPWPTSPKSRPAATARIC